MRQIGTIADADQARILADHLTARGVATRLIPGADGFAVWVVNEDHVPGARQELEAFQKDPADPRYQAAARAAHEVRSRSERLDRQYRKNVHDMSGHWDRVNFRRRPLTVTLIAVSAVVFFLTVSGEELGFTVRNTLSFSSLELTGDVQALRTRGLLDIEHGQVWRVLTPIFLHSGILHILFNMWWLRDLGTIIEYRRGTRCLGLLVLLSAVSSNVAEFAYEALRSPLPGWFGGMSGVVYALLGYVWMKGRFEPEQGMILHPRTVQLMLFWLVLCMTGIVGPIANVAHVVGLVVGMLYGLARF